MDEKVLRGKTLHIERLVSLGMTRAEKGDRRNYREGDRRNYREGDLVVFNQNLKHYRLERDEILTVRDARRECPAPTGRSSMPT